MLPFSLPARLSIALLGALTALCALALAGTASAATTVSLTFDDGSTGQYDLREILDDHGMEATFYVNSNMVGESSRMNWEQLEALASDGNEIGGHTLDHANLTTLTPGEAVHQICDDREQLAGRGFDPVSFAYPFGAFDARAKQVVEDCGYVSARSYTEGAPPVQGADTLPPADYLATKTVVDVGTDTSLEDMKNYVRAAEFGSGDWVQFVFHRVCADCSASDAVTIETFEELLGWLQSRSWLNTRVRSVREALGLGGLAAPAAPTGVQASAGGPTSARVSWTHSASGGPAASYEVTPYVGSTPQQPRVVSDVPPGTETLVTGLNTGTAYTFRVRAVNPVGESLLSAASGSVTPSVAVTPTAPTDVTAEPASGSAIVEWRPPFSDGQSALTGYRVTPYIGGVAQAPVEVDASETGAIVNGLDTGTAHTFRVAAVNAVGTGAASAQTSSVTPRSTILDFDWPQMFDSNEPDPIELGVKFRSDVAGAVTGIRFFKDVDNTGTHTGSLWTAGGQRLAQATFTDESPAGWQSVVFDQPVQIQADTTYVASYHAPHGHYSRSEGGLGGASGAVNPPLRALSNLVTSNGVYALGETSSFPTGSWNASNYYVDVLFAIPAPGQVTAVQGAPAGPASAAVSWSAPASGGPVESYEVTPYVGATPQAKTVISGTPPATSAQVFGLTTGTTYTFRVRAVGPGGDGAQSAASAPVTPTGPVAPLAPTGVVARPASESVSVEWSAPPDGGSAITGYTVTPYVGVVAQAPVEVGGSTLGTTIDGLDNGTDYTFRVMAENAIGSGAASAQSAVVTPGATLLDFGTPDTWDSGQSLPVELGMRFRADVDGEVTGVRFFKTGSNTGTHVGSLWTAGGTRLAHATFTSESTSGWQSVVFDQSVEIDAGALYVVSYHSPTGRFSFTDNTFQWTGIDKAPLEAPAASTLSGNGVYAYGGAGSFPSGAAYLDRSYWVDVLFDATGTPPGPTAPEAPTDVFARPAAGKAVVEWDAPADGGSAIAGYTVTPYAGAVAQDPVEVDASELSATVDGLTNGTAYTFEVVATNAVGDGPASAASVAVTPGATLLDFATPAISDSNQNLEVELGVKFQADVDGEVTGVRFFKTGSNTGTHVGSLWTAGGTRLAHATFTSESTSGWQSVTFAEPVEIDADTTYVVSYHSPTGRFSFSDGAFGSALASPPLHAPAASGVGGNGVYAYGGAGTFPTDPAYLDRNYWVDALFTAAP